MKTLACAVLACNLLASCASVPSTDHPPKRTSVRIATEHGWLGYQRSQDIVAKLGAPADAGTPGESDEARFLKRHMQVEEAINGTPLVAGNHVQLLADGPATYRAMLDAIAGAKQYIHMESYIFDDDEAGGEFADALIAKASQGVAVALMVDAVGTLHTPDAFFDRMKQAGVQVVRFNPINPALAKAGWAPDNRDHRKILVIDGKTAILGGINVSNVYSSSSGGSAGGLSSSGGPSNREVRPQTQPPPGKDPASADAQHPDPKTSPWRDTDIKLDGPAVAEVERVMESGWQDQHGPPLTPRDFTPQVKPQGDMVVRIVANRPDDKDNGATMYLTLISAIRGAQRSIHITAAYFVPDPAFVQSLIDAAKRGVDVVMVVPGFSDSALVFYAGRSHYRALLDAGVKLYERRDAFLHAKTVVIDGVWSTVGSANLDWRSFALNYELNAVILGSDFGGQMEALFQKDIEAATQITPEQWSERGAKERFMETVSPLFQRWL
jgi:cardiolipin synthase